MNDVYVVLERHEQILKTLANELKHINEHISKQEKKIEEIDNQLRQRMQQIVTAIIAVLSGGLISTILGMVLS